LGGFLKAERDRINKKPLEIWEPELAKLKMQEPLMLAGDVVSGLDIRVDIAHRQRQR